MDPNSVATIAWRIFPSSAAGKVNIKNPTDNTLNLSVDPNGVFSWQHNDGNYEQFTRNGIMMEIQPGGDGDPHKPTFVLLPK